MKENWNSYYGKLRRLEALANASLASGDTASAFRYARRLLAKNTDASAWNYGNEIHTGNQLLGLAAIKDGDITAAKAYLIAAGETPGSPQLDSFGPTMTLAQALLHAGESETVLEYLDLVGRFWAACPPTRFSAFNLLNRFLAAHHARTIAAWKTAIRAGRRPLLNRVRVANTRR